MTVKYMYVWMSTVPHLVEARQEIKQEPAHRHILSHSRLKETCMKIQMKSFRQMSLNAGILYLEWVRRETRLWSCSWIHAISARESKNHEYPTTEIKTHETAAPWQNKDNVCSLPYLMRTKSWPRRHRYITKSLSQLKYFTSNSFFH